MNFPMQRLGAEMMRAAAIAATEAGIEVCCPVHDAFLISASTGSIDDDVAAMREIMSKAGRLVTGGIDVRADVKIVRWPDRYMDNRGAAMWGTVVGRTERLGTEGPGAHQREPTVSLMTPDLLVMRRSVRPSRYKEGTPAF